MGGVKLCVALMFCIKRNYNDYTLIASNITGKH